MLKRRIGSITNIHLNTLYGILVVNDRGQIVLVGPHQVYTHCNCIISVAPLLLCLEEAFIVTLEDPTMFQPLCSHWWKEVLSKVSPYITPVIFSLIWISLSSFTGKQLQSRSILVKSAHMAFYLWIIQIKPGEILQGGQRWRGVVSDFVSLPFLKGWFPPVQLCGTDTTK